MIIYKATNHINGKIYIGQTIISLTERQGCHKRQSFKNNSPAHFHRAIRKYGFNSFEWKIIDSAKSREELNQKEQYWISFFNSFNGTFGYNCTKGGASIEFRDCIKKKISKTQKGRNITAAQSEARSIRMSGDGNNFYGKKHSEQTKSKISNSRKGKGLGQTHIQRQKCPHKGESNGNSSITEETAILIKLLLKEGIRNCEIQRRIGVTKNVLQAIKRERTWKYLNV